VGEGGVKAVI